MFLSMPLFEAAVEVRVEGELARRLHGAAADGTLEHALLRILRRTVTLEERVEGLLPS